MYVSMLEFSMHTGLSKRNDFNFCELSTCKIFPLLADRLHFYQASNPPTRLLVMKRAQRGPQNALKKEPDMKHDTWFFCSALQICRAHDVRYIPHKFLGKRETTLGNILSLITVGKPTNMNTKFKRLLLVAWVLRMQFETQCSHRKIIWC